MWEPANCMYQIPGWQKHNIFITKLSAEIDGQRQVVNNHYCRVVIQFVARLSDISINIFQVVITENCDLLVKIVTNQHIFQHISWAVHCIN